MKTILAIAAGCLLACAALDKYGYDHALMFPDLHEGEPCLDAGICMSPGKMRLNQDPQSGCLVTADRGRPNTNINGVEYAFGYLTVALAGDCKYGIRFDCGTYEFHAPLEPFPAVDLFQDESQRPTEKSVNVPSVI